MIKSLSSIVAEVEGKQTPEEQAEVLRKYDSPSLRSLLEYALHKHVNWLMPVDSIPPYRPLHEASDQEGRLYQELRKFDYFINTQQGLNLNQVRREQLFIQVLESIDPNDALMVLRVKDKKIKIDKKAVIIAFGDFAKGW